MMILIISMVLSQQVGTGTSFYIAPKNFLRRVTLHTKKALVPNSNSYKSLCNSVKEVLGIIMGLLKDRACAEEEPDRKRARIERYHLKK